jgi:hypothetical protein
VGAKRKERYAEKGKGGLKGGKGRLMAKSDFRVRKCCIYTYFFLSVGWLNRFGSIGFRL